MASISHPGRHNQLAQALVAAQPAKAPVTDEKKAETPTTDAAQADSSEKVT